MIADSERKFHVKFPNFQQKYMAPLCEMELPKVWRTNHDFPPRDFLDQDGECPMISQDEPPC